MGSCTSSSSAASPTHGVTRVVSLEPGARSCGQRAGPPGVAPVCAGARAQGGRWGEWSANHAPRIAITPGPSACAWGMGSMARELELEQGHSDLDDCEFGRPEFAESEPFALASQRSLPCGSAPTVAAAQPAVPMPVHPHSPPRACDAGAGGDAGAGSAGGDAGAAAEATGSDTSVFAPQPLATAEPGADADADANADDDAGAGADADAVPELQHAPSRCARRRSGGVGARGGKRTWISTTMWESKQRPSSGSVGEGDGAVERDGADGSYTSRRVAFQVNGRQSTSGDWDHGLGMAQAPKCVALYKAQQALAELTLCRSSPITAHARRVSRATSTASAGGVELGLLPTPRLSALATAAGLARRRMTSASTRSDTHSTHGGSVGTRSTGTASIGGTSAASHARSELSRYTSSNSQSWGNMSRRSAGTLDASDATDADDGGRVRGLLFCTSLSQCSTDSWTNPVGGLWPKRSSGGTSGGTSGEFSMSSGTSGGSSQRRRAARHAFHRSPTAGAVRS